LNYLLIIDWIIPELQDFFFWVNAITSKVVSMILFSLLFSMSVAATPQLEGTWKGHWISDVNGHNGPIKATFKTKNEELYVRFRGRYAKVLPFVYRTKLTTVVEEDGVHYLAEKSLGEKWGTFTLDATVSEDGFVALYRSQEDHGRFVLQPK